MHDENNGAFKQPDLWDKLPLFPTLQRLLIESETSVIPTLRNPVGK